jgi:GNAT superfamily N-acetyltransferase
MERLMRAYPIRPEDYPLLCSWWKVHGWPEIPPDHLPPTGFLVRTEEGEPAAAGFIYFTGTAFAIFEWAVVNPECRDRKLRTKALDTLLDHARGLARRTGVKTLFTSAHSRNYPWISRLERNSFTVTDSNMTNLIARVGD